MTTDPKEVPVTEDAETPEGVFVSREIEGHTFSVTAPSERKGVTLIREHARSLGLLADEK